jgi:hypothetical protein
MITCILHCSTNVSSVKSNEPATGYFGDDIVLMGMLTARGIHDGGG